MCAGSTLVMKSSEFHLQRRKLCRHNQAHATPDTSHITHHTSHITHHTSHITHLHRSRAPEAAAHARRVGPLQRPRRGGVARDEATQRTSRHGNRGRFSNPELGAHSRQNGVLNEVKVAVTLAPTALRRIKRIPGKVLQFFDVGRENTRT
jgi:hypothetical protein